MGEAKRRRDAALVPKKTQSRARELVLWHTTKPENIASILRDGFQDSAHLNRRGTPGALGEYKFTSGVWVGDTPALVKAIRQAFIEIRSDSSILSHSQELAR